MTSLIRAALLVAFAFSSVARADETGPVDPHPVPQPVPSDHDHPGLYGTFCSAATTDGYWGFVFNRQDLDTNCDYVDQVLGSVTRAPVFVNNSGYYQLQGWNEAVATCGLLRSYFTERGGLALQRAFNYAKLIGGQGCYFEVYFQQ